MRNIKIQLQTELKLFVSSRGTLAGLWLLVIAALFSIQYGVRKMEEQRAVLASLPTIQQWEISQLDKQYPDGSHAGNVGYSLYHPTSHIPSSWAALSVGQRDMSPYFLRIRLLGLQGQLYESGIENPMKSLGGNFDWAFVLVFLFPLYIIATTYNLGSAEREDGTWDLIRSQGISPARWILFRLFLRYVVAFGLSAVLLVIGMRAAGACEGPIAFAWLAVQAVTLLFWFAVVLLVLSFRRSSSFNAITLLGAWLALTLVLPATFNLVLATMYPVPHGQDLTLKQRQVVNAGWDLEKKETFDKFFTSHPQYADTAPVTTRFHWKWYFAMHQVGDDSVAGESKLYFQTLRRRAGVSTFLALLVPPVEAQMILDSLAGTDQESHLQYLESVSEYHEELESFFFPPIFGDGKLKGSDLAALPRHSFESRPPDNQYIVRLLQIAGIAVLILVMGIQGYSRREARGELQ